MTLLEQWTGDDLEAIVERCRHRREKTSGHFVTGCIGKKVRRNETCPKASRSRRARRSIEENGSANAATSFSHRLCELVTPAVTPVGLSKFAGFAPDGTEANFPMPREGRHRRARRSALCKA